MGPTGLLETSERRQLEKSMTEMFDSSPAHLPYDRAKVLTLWPQIRGELQGLANSMERGGSPITAEQIRLAVALADREVERMKAEDVEKPAKPVDPRPGTWPRPRYSEK